MIIRPARAQDAAQICEIVNDIVLNTTITFTTALKTPDSIAEEIATRGAAFQVAEEAGQVLGFATYFPFRAGPGYACSKEHSIVLAPQGRGRGAGRALMQALEAQARSEGVHSLWAGVSGENPEGLAFHKAIGFAETARLREVGHKFGRWMDLVLLQKFI